MFALLIQQFDLAGVILPLAAECTVRGLLAMSRNPLPSGMFAAGASMVSASLISFGTEPAERGKHGGFGRGDRRRTRRMVRAGKRAWLAGVAR